MLIKRRTYLEMAMARWRSLFLALVLALAAWPALATRKLSGHGGGCPTKVVGD